MANPDDLFAGIDDAPPLNVDPVKAENLRRFRAWQDEVWPPACPKCRWRWECRCAPPGERLDTGLAQ